MLHLRLRALAPLCALTAVVLILASAHAFAHDEHKKGPPKAVAASASDARASVGTLAQAPDEALQALEWRNIGPARGGRVQSVCGVVGDPYTYYMGATGGGVWKTEDGGAVWRNISDDALKTGSVGDIAVAPSDPNVIYLGMGEADVRGNFSHGDGVYRSLDAGASWEHVGLEDTRQIGRIAVHPTDPKTAFVAALGHVFGPNAQRGVFRTTDAGDTWERVCYVNDRTGAIDVRIDPRNPRVVYAGFWQVSRTPWSLSSGGEGSGLYKSTDGGDTWTELTEGLPKGIKGKISVSPSPAQRDLVYAIIEAEDGGVFRSSDAGKTWRRVNEDRSLRQRAWYYTHIHADPQDADTVYVLNVQFHKSTDGGRSFERIRVPHVDNHDLWIDPHNSQRMIESNDGGANVSYNGGATWSRQDNQPTAQFYRVSTDHNFPYRVLGAQQDNSTVSVSSRNRPGGREDFFPVGGGESGYVVARPDNPDIVYAGSYSGYLTEYDHDTGKARNITAWPENPMGGGADVLDHRFQWIFPIVVSAHDPDTLYVGGERVFKSANAGQSWTAISPDLTTNDKTKQASSGGPITKDNTGVEYYCTVFTIAESPFDAALLWAGSDDGLVHVTSDAGATWENVTPKEMGDWPMISIVEASPHDADTAYLAATRYKMDDFRPYIYRTRDRGASWDLIADGIEPTAHVRSVREDPVRPGLLFAGTETGVYVSFDHGDHWRSLQLNLPIVPVTDLTIKDDDLVISTQGRAFWILDDITPLRQLTEDALAAESHLFEPGGVHRQRWDRVRVNYLLQEAPEDQAVEIAFLDSADRVVRTFKSDTSEEATEENEWGFGSAQDPKVPAKPGANLFQWDMRREAPTKVPGAVGWPPSPPGPLVPPGLYRVRMTIGETVHEASFEIQSDPRVSTTTGEFAEQDALLRRVTDTLSRAHEGVNTLRAARRQIQSVLKRAESAAEEDDEYEELRELAKEITGAFEEIEETLIQTRSKSSQDPLNFPVKINDKLGMLLYVVEGDFPPTKQSYAVFAKLEEVVNEQISALDAILDDQVEEFNDLVHELRVPAVVIDRENEGDSEDE